jgi:RHS repeat-associated protein
MNQCKTLKYNDYHYPYGMMMPGRNEDAGDQYRYGYQGSEMDDEVKDSKGTSYTTHFRQLDPRVGRWLSIDPKATAWESPYASMANNPIMMNDFLGDSAITAEQELGQQIVDDLNEIYKDKYDLPVDSDGNEVNAFSLVPVKYVKKGYESYGSVDGYAIVTNDIPGDPDFWDDWDNGEEGTVGEGYRSSLYEVLNMGENIEVKYSSINGGWGNSKTDGLVTIDSNLSPAKKSSLSAGGVFLHEIIWHKSRFKHETKNVNETAHTMQLYYGLLRSQTPNSLHPGGNSTDEVDRWRNRPIRNAKPATPGTSGKIVKPVYRR